MPGQIVDSSKYIVCDIGACNFNYGTFAVISRGQAGNYAAFSMSLHDSGGVQRLSAQWEETYLGPESGTLLYASYFADGQGYRNWTALTVPFDKPAVWVVGKANGTVVPRLGLYFYDTDAWQFVDADSGTTQANGTVSPGSSGKVRLGWVSPAISYTQFVCGFWDRQLSDEEMKLLPDSLMGWHSTKPKGLWLLDQSATTQKVVDLTGGGANESSRTGTPTIDPRSFPIFNYASGALVDTSGGSGPDASLTPTAVAVPVVVGDPVVSTGTNTDVAVTAVAVPVVVGTPTVIVGAVGDAWATPTAVEVPVAIGSPTINNSASASVAVTAVVVPVAISTPAIGITVTPTAVVVPVAIPTPTLSVFAVATANKFAAYIFEGDIDTSVPVPHLWYLYRPRAYAGDTIQAVGYGFGDTQVELTGKAYYGATEMVVSGWTYVAASGSPSARSIDAVTHSLNVHHQVASVVVPTTAEAPGNPVHVETNA